VGSDTAPGLSVIQPQDRSKQTLIGKAMIHHFRRRTAQTLDLNVIDGMKRPADANENTALKTSLTLCFAEVLAPSAAAAGYAASTVTARIGNGRNVAPASRPAVARTSSSALVWEQLPNHSV
jgi:hypothetical protein